MGEAGPLLSPRGLAQKAAAGVFFSLSAWALAGTVEALIYRGFSGSPTGLELLTFLATVVVGYGAWGGILGLLFGLALAVVPIHQQKGRAEGESGFVPILHGATLSLVVLGYGLAWVNLNAFGNLANVRPPVLLGDFGLAGMSILVGVGTWWVSSRLIRHTLVFWSLLVGIVTFLVLLAGLGPILVIQEPGEVSAQHTAAAFGFLVVALLAGTCAARVTYFALLGRQSVGRRSSSAGRRRVVGGATTAILVLAAAIFWFRDQGFGRPKSPASAHYPNVLLITVDALRADHLSCYGYVRETTPTIDELASKGARCEWAIAQASYTSPSVASILTGNGPPLNGVGDLLESLPHRDLTLAEILRREQYRTAAVVSNSLLFKEEGYGQGFQTYDRTSRFRFNGDQRSLVFFWILARVLPRPRAADATSTTDAALRWLERNHREPFLLWIHYMDPHSPYNPPPSFTALYDSTSSQPEGFSRKALILRDKIRTTPEVNVREYVTEQELEHLRALYDGEIRYTDSQLEKLLSQLRNWGILEKTLIVISADHGEALGEHNKLRHSYSLYDETQRVPLIFCYPPQIPAGIVVQDQVRSIDIMPTVLEIAGIPCPNKLEGQSLLSRLQGNGGERVLDAFAENRPHSNLVPGGLPGPLGKRRMIRTPEWKLIYTPRYGDPIWELYNLKEDPQETRNLYSERKEVAEELKGRLLAWASSGTGEAAAPQRIDQGLREELKALGYVP